MNFLKIGVTSLVTIALSIAIWCSGSLTNASARTGKDPKALYDTNCAACHAKNGSGHTPAGKSMKVRDLASEDVQKQTDEALFEWIAKGKGKMPGYEKKLGQEKIHQLVTHIRAMAKKS
jgi:mono/diheme cytochrome c family protein